MTRKNFPEMNIFERVMAKKYGESEIARYFYKAIISIKKVYVEAFNRITETAIKLNNSSS